MNTDRSIPDTAVTIPDTIAGIGVMPPDSAAIAAKADSIARATLTKGLVMIDPYSGPAESRPATSEGLSWGAAVLALVFCLAGLRYRSNAKYLRGLLRDTIELRERNNMFDDTVRESTFKLLLLILTAGSLGLLLYAVMPLLPGFPAQGGEMAALACVVCVSAYLFAVPLLCLGFGSVFTGVPLAKEWTKGFTSGMGLLALPAFPAALIALFWPPGALPAAITVGIFFCIVKLLFIWRAFRIFMRESSSWVLFLYYLCNLEFVPLTLTFVAAGRWCAFLT